VKGVPNLSPHGSLFQPPCDPELDKASIENGWMDDGEVGHTKPQALIVRFSQPWQTHSAASSRATHTYSMCPYVGGFPHPTYPDGEIVSIHLRIFEEAPIKKEGNKNKGRIKAHLMFCVVLMTIRIRSR